MNNRDKVLAFMSTLGACSAAHEWVRSAPEDFDFERAWATCSRGDWLAWVIGELVEWQTDEYLEPKWGTLAACAAAECSLHHIPAGRWHKDAEALIEKVKAWASADEQTDLRVSTEARRLYDEAFDGYGGLDDRSHALAAVAYAGWCASSVESDLCYCVDNAISAADPKANDEGMRVLRNKEIADAIRKVVPWEVIETAINEYMSDSGIGENQEEVT